MRTGFVDLAQLSFSWNVDSADGLRALTSLHGHFRSAGATSFIVVAPLGVTPTEVREALPEARVSFVRLAPSEEDLMRHASSRVDDAGPLLAGDDVRGAPRTVINALVRHSAADLLSPLRDNEEAVNTRKLSLPHAVNAVRRAVRW